MNDKTVVYCNYYNPIEANIIKARLEDSGFSCFLADENVSTINPLFNQAIGGVKLIVFERDVEQIKEMLAEVNSPMESYGHETSEEANQQDKIICEACGSDDVGFGMATTHQYSWWVTIISLLFAVYPFKANKCYHCYSCGHEFR